MPSMGQLQRNTHSTDSRNLMSEFVPRNPHFQQVSAVGRIPNFERVMSANTSIERRDLSRRMAKNMNDNMQSNLLQSDVKQLADEWEGDPHDDEFWKRIEQSNNAHRERKG